MRILLALLHLVAALAFAEDPPWRALNRTAREAMNAKDYAKLRQTLIALQPLIPGNPRIVYNFAASNSMLGDREAALRGLRDLSAMGLVYDLAADEDFASLKGSPEFAAIIERMTLSKKPVTHALPGFVLGEHDLIPEDIAYDVKRQHFFISSVRQSRILTGDGKPFAKSEWPVFALAVDPKHRTLWATTGWVPQCAACDKKDQDKTALLAFDLDNGRLKQRIDSPWKGLLGDMTISSRGDIYVSEGLHGAVLHLGPGARQLERLDAEGEFPSPQTPALSADEKALYVSDYVRGIAALDLRTRSVRWLQPAPGVCLSGIDGLYLYRGVFLAVQNGTTPPRIVRMPLDLSRQEVLEANWSGLGDPTHGTIVHGDFYFLVNSGWNEYDANGQKKAGSESVESSVRKIRLK